MGKGEGAGSAFYVVRGVRMRIYQSFLSLGFVCFF